MSSPFRMSRILSDPFIATTIKHGETLQFMNATPATVWASVAEWKAADFARAFKRKDLKSAWEAFVAPGPVSVEKMMDFFVKYRLSFTCLNVAHEIIRRYKADDDGGTRNRTLGDSHLYFILHNDRMYRLDREQETFLRKHFLQQSEPLRTPPATMRAPRAFTYNLYAADRDALVNILRQPLQVPADRQTVSIAYGGDIEDLYLWFKNEHDYEVQPVVEDRRFKGLRLYVDRLIIIHGGFADASGCPKAFNDAMNLFKRAMFHESHRSTYSDDLFALFHHGKKAQLWRRFDAQSPDISVGVDVKSAYPAAAMKMDFIPVFLKTDRFRSYDGERIDDYSIYLVRNDTPNDVLRYILADRPLCGITGFVLNRCDMNFDIVAVCKPSHLARCPYKDLVRDLFNNDAIVDDSKKSLSNYPIGMMGKTKDQREYGYFCKTWEEARRISNEVTPRPDLGGFIATRRSDTVELADGFYPFQFFVYDINRLQMLNLARSLIAGGAKIYGILTDKIWCDHIPADLPLVGDGKRTLATLGGYKAEGTCLVPKLMMSMKAPVPITIQPEPVFTTVQTVTGNTFIEGSAGTRKTTAAFTGLDPATTLCVCPNNYQRDQQGTRFTCHAITTHEFLGLRVAMDGGGDLSNGRPADLTHYTHIVFEELPQNSIPLIVKIIDRVLETPGKTWIANGDLFQNSNAEVINNIGKREDYIMRILPQAFPSLLRLTTNYRLLCDAHPAPADNPGWRCECAELQGERKRMDDIREALKSGEDILSVVQRFNLQTFTDPATLKALGVKRVVTHSNATAHALNQFIHPEPDSVGMIVVAKPYQSSKDLIKNKEYKVEAITHDSYIINSKAYQKRLFRRPAGQTCDAIQGATITTPYAVFDVADNGRTNWAINRRWFYTAVSRTERFKNLWIYLGPPLVNMKDAAVKIEGYAKSDREKGRPGGLTVSQMMKQLQRDNFCCWICHQRVEVVYEDGDRRAYSMDRKNNDDGHHVGNVVTAHEGCNSAQGAFAKIRDIEEDDAQGE